MKKKYDLAKTPYQRVLKLKQISQETKKKLKAQYVKLNPAQLKRNINRLQNSRESRIISDTFLMSQRITVSSTFSNEAIRGENVKGDRWFCSEEEAKEGGFMKSKDCPK